MAKKPQYVPPTPEEEMEKAKQDLWAFNSAKVETIPEPTRTFVVGEIVVLGALKEPTVVEVLKGGKAYLIRAISVHREGESVTYLARWWFDIEKVPGAQNIPSLMSPYRPLHPRSCDINTIMHYLGHGGLVCDPKYQRGYVWTEANKDALIESVLERLDIGSVLLISHAGYNHKGDKTLRTYINLDGEEIQIARQDDYTNAIIDGQQRLTTLIHFITNKRPYKGIYFSQMRVRDQQEFLNLPMSIRMADEDEVTEKEVVRMFLQANRGVPQAPEHLAKVQALYNSMP